MKFYDKLVDRFQNLSKVKNPAVSNAKFNNNYLEHSKENVLRNMMHSHWACLKALHDMVLQNSSINS